MAASFMTRILHPTDFSDCAARAQECAVHVATAWDAELDVLHITEGSAWLWCSQSGLSLVDQVSKEAAQSLEVIHHQMVRSGLHAVVRQGGGHPQ